LLIFLPICVDLRGSNAGAMLDCCISQNRPVQFAAR
jgi:hypothetical protein